MGILDLCSILYSSSDKRNRFKSSIKHLGVHISSDISSISLLGQFRALEVKEHSIQLLLRKTGSDNGNKREKCDNSRNPFNNHIYNILALPTDKDNL